MPISCEASRSGSTRLFTSLEMHDVANNERPRKSLAVNSMDISYMYPARSTVYSAQNQSY